MNVAPTQLRLPRGILPSLPTPFDDDGQVDHAALRAVVRFAVGAGAAGLVTSGLAGEVERLTTAEREALLETVLASTGDGVPVLTGVTAGDTAESQRLARHAQRSGAAAIVLPPPTAHALDEPEIVKFFAEVASVVDLPAVVQDAPEYLSVSLRPETVTAAAARAPNIRAVKLEAEAEELRRWGDVLGPEFGVFGGNGGLYLLDCLRTGAHGVIPGVDTVDLQVEIERAEREGRHLEADGLFNRLASLVAFEMESIDHYNLCAKHVLRRRGINLGTKLRPPGQARLDADAVRVLDLHLKRLELLPPDGAGNAG